MSPAMPRPLFAVLLALTAFGAARAADAGLIDAMDELHFQPPKEKGKAELIDGKMGKAVRFSFDKDARAPSSPAITTVRPPGTRRPASRSGSRGTARTTSAAWS